MKITCRQLRKIIKEEISLLKEYTGIADADDKKPAKKIKNNLINFLSDKRNIRSMFSKIEGVYKISEEEAERVGNALGYDLGLGSKLMGLASYISRDENLKSKLDPLITVDGVKFWSAGSKSSPTGKDGYININSPELVGLLAQTNWIGSFTSDILDGVRKYTPPTNKSPWRGEDFMIRGDNLLVWVERK